MFFFECFSKRFFKTKVQMFWQWITHNSFQTVQKRNFEKTNFVVVSLDAGRKQIKSDFVGFDPKKENLNGKLLKLSEKNGVHLYAKFLKEI